MIRLILALLILAPLGRTTFGQQYAPRQPVFNPNQKVDGHVGYNSSFTADLPTGAQKLKLWVVISPQFRDAAHQLDYAVASWFTADRAGGAIEPRLKQLRDNCEFNYYFADSPLFAKSGLIQAVGNKTPIVCLTAPDGEVGRGALMNADVMPRSAGELADVLVTAVRQLNPPIKEAVSDPLKSSLQFEQATPTGAMLTTTAIVPALTMQAPSAEQCPDGNCPVQPIQQQPSVIEGSLKPIVPRPDDGLATLAGYGVGGLALLAIGLGAALIAKNRKSPTLTLVS
jgi:hypothetical protein